MYMNEAKTQHPPNQNRNEHEQLEATAAINQLREMKLYYFD
jgi:hypothetical protein